MGKVKVLKCVTGEDLIAECKDSDGGNILLKNPCILVPAQDGGVGIAPWGFMTKEAETGIEIAKDKFVFVCDPQDDFAEQYNKVFSPVVAPSSKIVTPGDLKITT